MDERGCPRCKTTKYRNPSLKLMVNVCGHSLCDNCVNLLFIKGSGVCPECGTALRRTNFRLQIFEDAIVEKEIDIRRKILRDFNKKEEEFDSLREYNDYLEMVETMIYNLSNNIDVDATKRQIDQYRKDNKEQIRKNQLKMSKDEQYLDSLIEEEQQVVSIRKAVDQEMDMKEKNAKKKNKEALIDELMFSDMSASEIISTHREQTRLEEEEMMETRAATAFSTGIKIGHSNQHIPLVKTEVGQLFHYIQPSMEWGGPDPPSMDEVYTDGYLKNIRVSTDMERAGGFRESIACLRAVQDAMCGLYSFPIVAPPTSS